MFGKGRQTLGGYVYIVANRKNGTIYTGVTNDIARRAFEHREGTGSRFAAKHSTMRLVYVEYHEDIHNAIVREKRLKKWNRAWKIRLIEQDNPNWDDLYLEIASP